MKTNEYTPLAITPSAITKSIIEDTPEHTRQLLMKLNPEYWRQFFKPEVVK